MSGIILLHIDAYKMAAILQKTFKCIFLKEISCNLDSYFTEVSSSQMSNWHQINICSIAWHLIGYMSLYEAMSSHFMDAYMSPVAPFTNMV